MTLQKFPGFIDIHVHLRTPGETHKEDFYTGSKAAISGGYTFVVDMPNNLASPTVTIERLNEKILLSKRQHMCDIGFHYGTDGKNVHTFAEASNSPNVYGLKVYCGQTTGNMVITDEIVLDTIFAFWKSDKPISVHAEADLLRVCLDLSNRYSQRLHVCHIANIQDLEVVAIAKKHNPLISVGVTPHHLFLTDNDIQKLGPYGSVKPSIGDRQTQEALWHGIDAGVIDIVESDHAPHTREEKESGTPPFGVPGLETTLGLLLLGVAQKKLTVEKVVMLLYDNPKRLFHISDQPNTYIELDPTKSYTVGLSGYKTKCGWSPFDGWELYGKVETVVYRNKPLVREGVVL